MLLPQGIPFRFVIVLLRLPCTWYRTVYKHNNCLVITNLLSVDFINELLHTALNSFFSCFLKLQAVSVHKELCQCHMDIDRFILDVYREEGLEHAICSKQYALNRLLVLSESPAIRIYKWKHSSFLIPLLLCHLIKGSICAHCKNSAVPGLTIIKPIIYQNSQR